jgi:hypothetical protein
VYDKDYLDSIGSYSDFLESYKNIFGQVYSVLDEDSFLVLKLGEIRDKNNGEYRGFIADNIRLMQDIGFKYYNELIMVLSHNTAFLKSDNYMRSRKMVKTHQNILVFYKGDVRNIKDKYGVVL